MTQGTVRWFNLAKGYGFIAADGSEDDVFVRFSDIQADGLRVLADGQRVEFELGADDSGPHAASVRSL